MRVLYLLFIFWCASASSVTTLHYPIDRAAEYFEEFIVKFDKKYKDQQDFAHRLEIFKYNLENINHLNNESGSLDFGITQFMDLTYEEFKKRYTGLRSYDEDSDLCEMLTDKDIPDVNAPESFHWRTKNVVTRVKNQKRCASCWAFSTCGHLESQFAIKHNQLIEFSEQGIINCDRISDGCCGGSMSLALKALIKVGGLMKEVDLPYNETKLTCRMDQSKAILKVASCNSYNLTSQEKVKQLLYKTGPIPIAVKSLNIQNLEKGAIIKDSQCIGELDHAVLLVGYGTENNVPYWIVKNSWGSTWCDSGYFRMERGNNSNGACGMLNTYMATAVVE